MKKRVSAERNNRSSLTKTLLIMKLFMFLMLVATIQAKARTYGQNISMNVEKTEVKKILGYFEKSTRVRFLYNYELKPLRARVDFSAEDLPLQSALTKLLANTGLGYKMLDNNLVVIIAAANVREYLALQITGRVTGDNNEPLAGVSVTVKGTNNGVNTDVNGSLRFQPTTTLYWFLALLASLSRRYR